MSTKPTPLRPMPSNTPQLASGPGFANGVLAKLLLFSIMMAVVPIGTYFGTLKYYFHGSTTPSAISAVVAANIVLAGYVIMAFREDSGPQPLRPLSSGAGTGAAIGRKKAQ